ncbi:MAG: FadR family transcriptional regulator [Clostridiaceae bacterium]|jgi:GntR family transcriptional repressor for pyruvate dehydrogenase complex|nr:FadR family transcriptional regulator [Clostridiaceae bacterium]
MPVKPIERVHVGDAVFVQLKNLILSGEWAPGSRLPAELALKEQFGVSRMSIRSALERLKSLGLIEARQGSGTYVREENQAALFDAIIPVYVQGNRDMIEILEFRLAIECEAARLACLRMDTREIGRLKRLYEKMRQAVNDPDEAARLDLDFHLQIVKLSQNRYFYQVEQILRDILSVNFRKVIEAIGPDIGIQFHELILAAFAEREPERAYSLMKTHLQRTIDKIREYRTATASHHQNQEGFNA